MTIKNIPTSQDYYNKAKNLYFESITSLMNNIILYENDYHDRAFIKYILPSEINNIVNSFHQSFELFLKGKIAETSPFLLLKSIKKDFNDSHTIDANELLNIVSVINNDFISKPVTVLFNKYRNLRNSDIHGPTVLSILEIEHIEYLTDFLRIYEIFNTNSFATELTIFLENKYNTGLLKNKFPLIVSNYRSIYFRMISRLIKKINVQDETTSTDDISINVLLLNIINLKTKYPILPNDMMCCPDCKFDYQPSFDPSLEYIDEFIEYNQFKSLYKIDNGYKCFSCEKIYKNISNRPCKICNSLNKSNNQLSTTKTCLNCGTDFKPFLINTTYLEYGCQTSKDKVPNRYFYTNNLDFDASFHLYSSVNNLEFIYSYNGHKILLHEAIIGSCIDYNLFYLMNIKSGLQNSDIYYKDTDKLKFYQDHLNNFNINDTLDFAFKKYSELTKKSFKNKKYKLSDLGVAHVCHIFYRIIWHNIFISICEYYKINGNNVKQQKFQKLHLKLKESILKQENK